MPAFADLWTLLQGGGALALAVFLIFAFMRGWIVPRFIYDAMEKRLERSLGATESTAQSLDRLTDEIRGARAPHA